MNAVRYPRRVCLWGMPGVGKSTVGAVLAGKAGMAYWDLDEYIQEAQGRSIVDLIQTQGKDVFRALEKTALDTLMTRKQGLIALGGGALLDPVYRAKIRERCFIITLWTSATELQTRLVESEVAKRPLLHGSSSMHAQLHALMTQRECHYRDVDLVLNVEGLSVHDVVGQLEAHLAQGIAA